MATFSNRTARYIADMVKRDRAMARPDGSERVPHVSGPTTLFAVTASTITAGTSTQLGTGTATICYANAAGALTTSSVTITIWNRHNLSITSGVNITIDLIQGMWVVRTKDC
jgi:hypothetical protein